MNSSDKKAPPIRNISGNQENSTKIFIMGLLTFIILLVCFTSFLRIPFILNSELTYNLVFYLNLGAIIIFSVGILFRPWIALFICIVGAVIGELFYCIIFGCGESLPAYLIMITVSSGLAGGIISFLNQKIDKGIIGEIIAMVIGGIWQYFGLVISAFIYYEVFISGFHWQLYAVYYAYPLFSTIYDLFLIPLSIILNFIIRKIVHIENFHDLLTEPAL